MGRWLAVHVGARGLRRGLDDDELAGALRRAFRHRGGAWIWEVIGDTHLLNDRRQVRRGYKAWRKQDA